MNDLGQPSKIMTYRSVLFPAPAAQPTSYRCKVLICSLNDVRFPYIHKSDPFAFHSVNALLSKNHVAVPLSRKSETKF